MEVNNVCLNRSDVVVHLPGREQDPTQPPGRRESKICYCDSIPTLIAFTVLNQKIHFIGSRSNRSALF